jgi:hypothetical protein
MMRKLFFLVFLIPLIPLVVNAPASAANRAAIIGKVTDASFEGNENITAVSLETGDGHYLVDNRTVGEKLLKLSGKNVKATGPIGEDNGGYKVITVKTYEVLKE